MTFRLRPCALAAAALGLGLAASAHAQSSVTIYGLLDMNVGSFQSPGGERTWQASNGDMSTSYLGFSGKEDLGGGLAANFAFESFFRPDTGKSGRVAIDAGTNTDVFWARSANVGLSSASLGGVKLGRSTTTLFISTLLFNPFGDSFGFSPSIRAYYTRELIGDSGWSNSITYNSPNFGGLSFALQGNLGEGGANAVGKNLGGHVLYFGGPLAATVAVQQVKNNSDLRFGGALPPGFEKQDAAQLGLRYDFGVLKLYGQAGYVKTTADVEVKAKIGQLGVSVPIGAGAVLASYGYDRRTVDDVKTIFKTASVAYDYNLSKRTDVYAVYMNERRTDVSSGNTYAVGVRHKF